MLTFYGLQEAREELGKKADNLRVCEHCLEAIESREGGQLTACVYFDDEKAENEAEECRCQWCDEYETELYILI